MKSDFKRFFMRGLGALAPTLLTIAILVWAYHFVDENLGKYITRGVVRLYGVGGPPHKFFGVNAEEVALRLGDPVDEWHPETGRRLTAQYKTIHANPGLLSGDDKVREAAEKAAERALWDLTVRRWKFFNAIGFIIAIALIYLVGYFLASFIGRTTWLVIERLLLRIPLIGTIYPNIKQVTDFFISDRKVEFSGVVAVQYPRKGIWSVGLVTGAPMQAIGRADTRELMTVFIPSSPTPVTGYTIVVAYEDVLELPLTIDEALRYTISGGVVKPGDTTQAVQALATTSE